MHRLAVCLFLAYVHVEPTDRGTIGANTILGDKRWAGDYGIDADFWAHDNCKVDAVFFIHPNTICYAE